MAKAKTRTIVRYKTKSPAIKRRRSVGRRRGGLNDLFNPTQAMNAGKQVLASAGGGMGAVFIDKMLPTGWGKFARLITYGVGGFLITSVVNQPALAGGFVGGGVALAMQNGLNDDDENPFANSEALADKPIFLSDDGEPMFINDNGQMQYLSDEQKANIDWDAYTEV